MEQLNFSFGLGGALPKGYTLSSYTFGQAINTIDIESVNIPENVKVILNTFISNDKIMNVPLSNNKALMSYFKIIKKFNVKRKADFLDFLVTREYISEFPDNNPTKESEVAVGILDSYIENTNGQVIIENNSGQVMANGGGVGEKVYYAEGTLEGVNNLKKGIIGDTLSKLVKSGNITALLTFDNKKEADKYYSQNSILQMGLSTLINPIQKNHLKIILNNKYKDGGGVGNKKLEIIKNRLFAKHKK